MEKVHVAVELQVTSMSAMETAWSRKMSSRQILIGREVSTQRHIVQA